MKTVNVVIVDDEVHAQNLLESLIVSNDLPFRVVQKCSTLAEAVSFVQENTIDLMFLDVEMPVNNGTKINEFLPREERPDIIFVTAYDSFAIDAIRLGAFDYLVKPIDRTLLTRALHRYFNEKLLEDENEGTTLAIATHQGTVMIKFEDIIYLKASGSYTEIVSTNQKLMASKPISFFEKKIPPYFTRVHRSHIVNKNKILKLNKQGNNWWITLDGASDLLAISRKYRAQVELLLP